MPPIAPPTTLHPEMIQQLIDMLKQNLVQDAEFRDQFMGPPRPHGPPGEAKADMAIETQFRIEDFGLFEPDLIVDATHPPGDVISIGRDTIYRNVDAFVTRVHDAATVKGADLVRSHLDQCLPGTASR